MSVNWFQDAVIYQVFIDRFAGFESTENWDEPVFLGGDLNGVRDRLDHIEDLGIDVIWLSPFYKTSSYHGYHVTDFYTVDPSYGTEEDLENLIEDAHSRGIKVIADFVPNHCSREHPYFEQAQNSRESKYHDWFYFEEWPDNYLCFLEFDELPKINLENPEARNHILDAARYWLEKGLDGYRLDHVEGPSNSFWKKFYTDLKSDYPDKVFVGEAWMRGIRYQELETLKTPYKRLKWFVQQFVGPPPCFHQKSYEGLMDGVLDFRVRRKIDNYVDSDSVLKKRLIETSLMLHYFRFKEDFILPTFLDNHDMDRFLHRFNGDKDKLLEALELQLSIDQPTIIYYGTETGLSHELSSKEFEEHGDLQARKPMNWDEIDQDLLQSFKKRIKDD